MFSISAAEKEQDIERRRANGEIACAECRRQKLKCDKKIPCSSCIRRGCETVCPNGLLASRHGPKAKAEMMERKMLQMSKRIRQLEDAVQILQAYVSQDAHPLLAVDLLEIKNVELSDSADIEEKEHENNEAEMYSDFGTLTIAEQGVTRFVGRSGAEKMLATAMNDKTEEIRERVVASLAPELSFLSETFPFTLHRPPKERVMAIIKSRLPSYERATALVEAYLAHISCFFRPVEREQIMEELLPRFYKRQAYQQVVYGDSEIVPHQLALLLAVLACGAAGDLTLDACNEEGETYHQLARSALSLRSIFEGTSLTTVQAVALIGTYDVYTAGSQTIESAYKMHSLAFCLGISIGLHWDPLSWGAELKYVQRRRNLFWELYTTETFKSLASGRPAMIRADEFNCRLPDFCEGESTSDPHGFWRWKFEFATKIGSIVATKMCAVRPIKYSEILELDRKVREQLSMKTNIPTRPELPYTASSLQGLLKSVFNEAVLLFIHRNFFIKALQENRTNPLESRFASSFLATYSGAITTLKLIRRDFNCSNHLLFRQWTLWVLALACGVVVGSIAATKTLNDLSHSALRELDLAIVLFKEALLHPVAKNGLPILLRLRKKARSNLTITDGRERASTSTLPPGESKTEEVDEALSMIGGTKHEVKKVKAIGSKSGTGTSSPTSSLVARELSGPDPQRIVAANYSAPSSTPQSPERGSDSDWIQQAPQSQQGYPLANYNGVASLDSESTYGAVQASHVQQSGYTSELMNWNADSPFCSQPYASNNPTGQHTPAQSAIAQRFGAPPVSTSTDRLREYAQSGSNGFPMNVDVSGNDFDVHGIGGMAYLADSLANSRMAGEEDATIEDAWRSILEDPRVSTSGLTDQFY